jgi:hypothetical protein
MLIDCYSPLQRIGAHTYAAPDVDRMDSLIESLLLRVHDSSGSVITANSRRLRTLRNHAANLEQCRRDVLEDIRKYANVSVETKARCVQRFAQRANVDMRVCGACGIRDPFDPCDKKVDLDKLSSDHWLCVKQDAYDRLKQSPVMELLAPGPNGSYAQVRVSRLDLHNHISIGHKAFHAIPESLIESNTIRLCKRCARGFKGDTVAKRANCAPNGIDDFEDLYATNAPKFSIASGADFGRLSALRSKGIRVDVSTLERLVLAEARCHQVVYKVVAYGDGTDRRRLQGHSIVCPQNATGIDHNGFGHAALHAAFAAVRIVFVGPNGMRSKLEDAALKIDDFRLRPDVIFNFLTVNKYLHNGPDVPSLVEVTKLISDNTLEAHIRTHARCVTDTTVEKSTSASDVANVRLLSQSSQHRNGVEDPEADATTDKQALSPCIASIGLLHVKPQEMGAILEGIHKIVTEGEGGNAPDNNVRPSNVTSNSGDAAGTNARTLHLQRDDNVLNDYEGAAEVIYKTWWSLLPLRRGFVRGRSIPDGKWRQVMLYFDNRFAHDHTLLFHAADMVIRHAVNRAVSARVSTSPGAFAKFKELLHDESFLEKLAEARTNPKGVAAREILSRVIGFINLSGSRVPWGSRERAAEMTKLIADHRYAGPSSIFYSVAPDDVHNLNTLRWASAFTGEETFPAKLPVEFLKALRGQQPSERTAYTADGSVSFAMDETSLQLQAAKNPIACAISFDHLVDNIRTNLLGLTSSRIKDKMISGSSAKDTREPGIYAIRHMHFNTSQ